MDLQVPVIVLLLIANVLWFIVGWGKGFQEGKREGLIVGKNYQHQPVKHEIYALPSDVIELNSAR
jgi:hypothetical protein